MRYYLLTMVCFLITLSASSQQQKVNYPSQQWGEIVSSLENDLNIKVFYKSTDLTDFVTNLVFDKNDAYNEINTQLKGHGFTIIEYTPQQWVVVKSSDASTSLAMWRKREELLNQTISMEEKELQEIVVIGDPDNISEKSILTISGTILEENTGEPVIGATIEPLTGGLGTTTDINGKYTLSLPLGENQLTIKSIGLSTLVKKVILYNDATYDINLLNDAINLDEIVVTDQAIDENIRSTSMGVEALSLKEIKKLPSFMGELDVVKSLLTLPGVSTAGEGVGGLNIRGGNTDQNLILQDDIMFFNPSHALGFFSLFHPDLVDDVKLYKGNIPAKYGGRISSVLSTASKTGNKENWKIKGGLGLVSSKIAFDGPIIKNKLSMTLGARMSTINWLLGSVQVPDVQNSHVNFYDVQGKLNYWFNNTTSMGVQFYKANDDFQLGEEIKFDYQTESISAYFKTLLGSNKNLNVRLISGKYGSKLNDLLPANASIFDTGVDYLSGKADLTIQSNEKLVYNFGVEAINYTVNPGSILPGNETSEVLSDIVANDNGIEVGAFANVDLEISDKFSVSAGVRISGFGAFGEKEVRNYSTDRYFESESLIDVETIGKGEMFSSNYGIEPRLSLNYVLNESTSVKASYNRTYQYLSQISNTVAATPIDFWKLSDNNIQPQFANTVSLGYYKNFNDNAWETSIELYHRDINNAVDYRDFPDLLANHTIEKELLIGLGKNYGAEFSAKKTVGKVTTRLAYTYSRSLRKMSFERPDLTINQGQWYSSNFDKPHDLNLILNLNPRKRFSFNINFTYSTGRPITAPEGKYDDWNVFGIPIFSSRNNYRIPDFHRLDLSMNVFPGYRKDKKWKGSWTFSLYNVYSRKNAYSVYFRQQSIGRLRAYQIAVLGTIFPAISYNFEFL